jgi:hypothetical protein
MSAFSWLGIRDSPRSKRKILLLTRPQLPLVVLGLGAGIADMQSRSNPDITNQKKAPLHFLCMSAFSWLGFGYGNITFEDSLDFDISEIDSVYEDKEER